MKANSDSEKDPHRAYSRWRDVKRRASRSIKLHDLTIGGDAAIAVQSMTNTPTTDVKQTLEQIAKIRDAGADLVRVSCPDEESTKALKSIVKQAKIPVVADIHFHYKRAIEAAYSGAACLRFNPGNIGDTARVKEVVKAAKEQGAAIRIGVNAGSLERRLLEKYGEPCPEAMVESALNQANLLQELDFDNFKISVKASNTLMAIGAYRQLAAVCDHPLHIGITEAGSMMPGTVKSAIGLGALLMEGIGDTLRVSLSAEPHEEVKVGFLILKSLGIRSRGVTIVSCPSCARQQFDVIRVVEQLEERLSHIRESLVVSVIGCVVNGPGEARQANIGLTGGGNNTHQLYLSGLPYERLKDANVVDELAELVEKYLADQKQTEKSGEQKKVVDSIE